MSRVISQIEIAGNYAQWVNVQNLPSLSYTCWNCNTVVSSDQGYRLAIPSALYNDTPDYLRAGIYICHRCGYPTFLLNGIQVPGIPYGKSFEHVPEVVNNIYNEARNCYQADAFTAVMLLCRKILMHIGVEQGAEENKTFQYYIEYLEDHNLITATSTSWVDKIRQMGNRATHDLTQSTEKEAKIILNFTAMLLTTTYEYPAMGEELDQ